MYRTVVTICTTSLTFSNSTFCPHSVFMCSVWISEETAIISLYNIKWLVFIAETECVYCAVRTGYWYILQVNLSSYSLITTPLAIDGCQVLSAETEYTCSAEAVVYVRPEYQEVSVMTITCGRCKYVLSCDWTFRNVLSIELRQQFVMCLFLLLT